MCGYPAQVFYESIVCVSGNELVDCFHTDLSAVAFCKDSKISNSKVLYFMPQGFNSIFFIEREGLPIFDFPE